MNSSRHSGSDRRFKPPFDFHKSLMAVFGSFVVTLFGWFLLSALWNRLSPDYDETAFIAIWRIPQIAQRSIAGFIGGYVASWLVSRQKFLHAAVSAVPFALFVNGIQKDMPLPPWANTLMDPGIPAVFTTIGGWIQAKYPLRP